MGRTKTKTPRTRSYARYRATASRKARELIVEPDSTYFLKLVLIVILGTLWIKFAQPMSVGDVPFNGLPLGMIVGLMSIRLFEKNPYNRKIWYAVLIVIGIISYFVPAGIVL